MNKLKSTYEVVENPPGVMRCQSAEITSITNGEVEFGNKKNVVIMDCAFRPDIFMGQMIEIECCGNMIKVLCRQTNTLYVFNGNKRSK